MSKLKQLLGQTVIYGASSIIGRVLNFALTPLFTNEKVFEASQFGIITEMYAYVAFLVVMLTFGMETTYFRFSNNKENDGKNIYGNVLTLLTGTTATFIILAFAFSQNIADWLKQPDHSEYVIWFAIIVGLDALGSIPLARLRQENKAKKFAIVNLVNIGVFITANLFFLVYCRVNYQTNSNWLIELFYNPEIGVGYVFISNLLASIVKFSLLIPEMRVKFHVNKELTVRMLKYSYPLLFVGLAGIINETLDRAMLKEMLYNQNIKLGILPQEALKMAQTKLGIYGANYKITMIIAMAIQAYRYAAEPFFFKESKEKNAKNTYALIMNYFVIAVTFMFLAVALNLQIFRYFTPNTIYWEGLTIVPILLLANLSFGIYVNQSIWYKLSNKTIYGAMISIMGAIITIAINLSFIPKYGYVASAWATLICYVSMMVVSYFLGQKYYPIAYNLRKIGVYVIVALGLFFARYRQDLTGDFNFGVLAYHFLLLLVFLGIVVFLEQKTLKRILPARITNRFK
jgi:O-antigen/teichoic acid export membrane protein